MLEWRIAHSGAIDYHGDLLTPPDERKKKSIESKQKTIRSGNFYDSDSDGLSD